jgi:ATPase subunit of ABC transporter with duplicated ATPase domains
LKSDLLLPFVFIIIFQKENSNFSAKEQDVENGVRELFLMPTPVTLSWHEVSYDVILPVIKRPRTILNCISGWGEPNDMVAFIGGQAAGKTTLLNCLAGIICNNLTDCVIS